MKYESPLEASIQTGSVAPFYEQFETAKPEIGGFYKISKGTWSEMTFEIVAIVEDVAIGVCRSTKEMGTTPVGKKKMFVAEGHASGWAYNDNRSAYRLQNI